VHDRRPQGDADLARSDWQQRRDSVAVFDAGSGGSFAREGESATASASLPPSRYGMLRGLMEYLTCGVDHTS
jgi:hypothetical protein